MNLFTKQKQTQSTQTYGYQWGSGGRGVGDKLGGWD